MRIKLISSDRFLYRLCREVLLGFRDRAWDFGMVASFEQAGEADLFLWDLQPESPFPDLENFDPDRKGVFLIARRHLRLLQGRIPLGFSIVLKPVNPVLLRALLEEAVSKHEARSVEGQIAEQLRLERDEILQYLLQANLKLQEYDQDRTNFLARSVHDFRAPITAIQGYCELLLDQQLGPLGPDQAKVLEGMRRSIKRIARLTASMFQMSAGPQAPVRPVRRNGDIESCIKQAVHEVTPVMESKQIKIITQVQAPRAPILIDEMQIEQVLVNLLDNACRYTPRGGEIRIKAFPAFWDRRFPQLTEGREQPERREAASRGRNAYRVEVTDSGPGVPAGDLERIFEEYTTSDENPSRAGLGLAICRQLVLAHRGMIFAESQGQGATFVFILPYAESKSALDPTQTQVPMVRTGAGQV